MRLQSIILSPLLLFPVLALTADLSILIPPSTLIPNPSSLPPSTSASLTTLHSAHTAPLSLSNTFHFRNISAGSYLVSVRCPTHVFAPLRVDVAADGTVLAWRAFLGQPWDNRGEARPVVGPANTVEVRAMGGKDYYMLRPGFSPLSILKNPMILIAGFSLLVVFGMPYLVENMDPEIRAEFEANQNKNPVSGLLGGGGQQKGANSVTSFDAAAWLAGSGKKSEGRKEQIKEQGVSR